MNGTSLIKDRYGNDFHFGNAGCEWLFPSPLIPDFRDHIKQIGEMELKDDDVFLVSHPRSGTNWSHQILSMLLHNTLDYVGFLGEQHIDWLPIDGEMFTACKTHRLLSSHLSSFYHLPRQIKPKKVKVIYVYRNPKDTWVSLYNMAHNTSFIPSYDGTWSQFFDFMIDIGFWCGNWFDHIINWEKAASENPDLIHFVCYEEMKQDLVKEVMKINQFLGLKRDRQMCQEIAEACQFPKLKAAKDQLLVDMKLSLWKDGFAGHYRKGEIGDWKNWFTVEQNERFDALFEKRMSDSKLKFIFE